MDITTLQEIEQWSLVNKVKITGVDDDCSSVCFTTTDSSKFIANINGRVNIRSIKRGLKITPVSMSKTEIHKALKNYLEENSVSMLSDYNGVKSKIIISANDGFFKGLRGSVNAETLLVRLKANKPFYPEMTNFTQGTKDELVKDALEKFGAVPCETYKGSNCPILFTVCDGVYKGMYGTITFSVLKRGSGWQFSSLTDTCKVAYFNKYAKSRGYEIISLPANLRKSDRVMLRSPQGNEWETSWSGFENGRNCPSDTYAQSYGERLVCAVLSENDVPFTAEYCFLNSTGTRQFMDFYVEHLDKKYCIEYNGIQHYAESAYFANSLQENNRLDNLKKAYCTENNITYIEVPYSADTPESVFIIINEYIELHKIPTSLLISKLGSKNVLDSAYVIQYYKDHTYRQTLSDLAISGRELDNVCKLYEFNKLEWINSGKTTFTTTH